MTISRRQSLSRVSMSTWRKKAIMDSNMAGFLYNASTFETMYHQVNKDDGFIDLGLSLKTLHPQACHAVIPVSQSVHLDSMIVPAEYHGLLDWPYTQTVNLNSSKTGFSKTNPEDYGEDLEAVQSKERRSYVKVNMDGVVVGRKICPGDYSGYFTLAVQLEEMFDVPEFFLFYKDKQEHWRPAGDVPWKDFVDSVKRLRIVPKNKVSVLPIPKNFP
ncbi:auxin-responsive protein IAA32 isoform X2 [Silene latifolia]|uniref:auxin-responsive protein IAA32 isoform X2 n=1 Tax=Silene latifolia TaxID=37657 RepID=UPI003D775D5D